MSKQYRHGDVYLREVAALPNGALPVKPLARGVVLAEGEATGHAHTMPAETVKMWSYADQAYVTVAPGGATLTHEEHGDIPIPEGTFQVIRQREYAPEENRFVAD